MKSFVNRLNPIGRLASRLRGWHCGQRGQKAENRQKRLRPHGTPPDHDNSAPTSTSDNQFWAIVKDTLILSRDRSRSNLSREQSVRYNANPRCANFVFTKHLLIIGLSASTFRAT
jgi:hypothetical protein